MAQDSGKPAAVGFKPPTTAAPAKERKRTESPVGRKEFAEKAVALDLGELLRGKYAATKDFSSGSFGWFFNDKLTVLVNGKPCKVQPTLTFTVVGSKDVEE